MTREEAYKTIKENLCAMCSYGSQCMELCDISSCDNKDAIKALEQEPTTKNDLAVDCIDRNSIKYYPGTGGYMYASKGEIDKLPPITPQEPRWIPVSERLPEANRAVLTYIDIVVSKTFCLAYWSDVNEAWEDWMGFDLIEEDRGYKVIAWMPLPSACERGYEE